MFKVLAPIALTCGLIWFFGWAFITFRLFRIVLGLVVILGGGYLWIETDRAEKERAQAEESAKREEAREQIRQAELWSKVSPDKIEVTDGTLSASRYGEEFEVRAAIANNSDKQLGAFDLTITVQDCTPRKICKVIGQTSKVFWADVPPQQVRGISGRVPFYNLPPLKGALMPDFKVTRVYAGDFLDQWGVVR